MPRGNRIKQPAVPTPNSTEELGDWIEQIGNDQRALAVITAAMNDELTQVRAYHEKDAKPHTDRITRLAAGCQAYCEANRETLTGGGKTKTIRLRSGEALWRKRPDSVALKNVAEVLAYLEAMKLDQFIRHKKEVNREAMLADKAAATQVPGVTITGKEDFVIVPDETKLEQLA